MTITAHPASVERDEIDFLSPIPPSSFYFDPFHTSSNSSLTPFHSSTSSEDIPIHSLSIFPSISLRTASQKPMRQSARASTASAAGDPRRSSRTKKLARQFEFDAPAQTKRSGTGAGSKRTLGDDREGGDSITRKKAKMDTQKAQTAATVAKRELRDVARMKWFVKYKALLEPILPSGHFESVLESMRRQPQHHGKKHDQGYVEYEELLIQPELVKGGEMKDYQLQGLSFLVWMYRNGMNCILGDEMGLGKTLQTLSLFAHIQGREQGFIDPHLVICPLSVLSSWQNEAARWLPSMNTLRFHGTQPERERLKNVFKSQPWDIVITTYDVYSSEDSWFKANRWTYCVLDEGHKIKNAGSNLSHELQGLGSMYRLILTGTPVQNNLVELWGLLHWLYPVIFTSRTEHLFKNAFNLERGSYEIPFLNASKKLVSTIMLRRTKAVIEKDIPEREEMTIFLPLTEAQRFWTYRLLTRMDTLDLKQIFAKDGVALKVKQETGDADAYEEGRREVFSHLENQMREGRAQTGKWKRLMNLLMQLRQICDHPYLLPNAEPDPYAIGEHVIASSSKLIAIDKLLAHILPHGERVLIFSQWTKMLDVLEDFLALRAIPYARLDGSTRRPRRNLDIRLFQQESSPYQVFLISTKAGGLGINLTKASTVIMCDSDWNPQNDLQAIARAHRLGQKKVVKVYRLICRGSVEDQMLDRIRRKLFLSIKIMGSDKHSPANSSGESDDEKNGLGSNELLDILRRGSSALSADGQEEQQGGMDLEKFLKAGIEEILEDSRAKEEIKDAKLERELNGTSKAKKGAFDETKCDKPNVDGETDGLAVEKTVVACPRESNLKTNPKNSVEMLAKVEEEEKRLLSGIAQVSCRLFEGRLVQRMAHKDIANEWQELQKRSRVDRTVTVGGMTFIPDSLPVHEAPAVQPKVKRPKFGSEDYCVFCHDGGEVYLCTRCPRVMHARCVGVSGAKLNRDSHITCPQHNCALCTRNTAESGGMLFRCRFCPTALCEDCLPPGEIEAIGDTLPEFEILNYGAQDTAYYFQCKECHEYYEQWPDAWKDIQSYFEECVEKLQDLRDPNGLR